MSEYIVNLDGELGMALAVACAGAGFAREEIVRCKDCVYMTNRKYKNSLEYQTCSFFDSEYAEVEPNGFCAWGRRDS